MSFQASQVTNTPPPKKKRPPLRVPHSSRLIASTRTPTHTHEHTTKKQTSSLAGTFDVLSKQELREHGVFAAVLSKDFETPVFGGWTLELTFNKPVLE